MKKRIDELASQIMLHKSLYYQGRPTLSDQAYDQLEAELRNLNPAHPVLSLVGHQIENDSIKVAHRRKMLSLEKCYNLSDLKKWIGPRDVVSTLKVDGVSCALIYKQGRLVQAKTRGDGSIGEDVTAKVLWIESIPKILSPYEYEREVEIRGELYCGHEKFRELGDEMAMLGLDRPNSRRNIVAGLIGRKENLELCRYLDFVAFDIEFLTGKALSYEIEKAHILETCHFQVPSTRLHIAGDDGIEAVVQEVENLIFQTDEKQLPYQIDGLVFSFNDLALATELGATAHHPRYKMAFKFSGETKVTQIEEIEWSPSRNGVLTPVALVSAVELSGAVITRVTLHNWGLVRDHNLKVGDKIEVIRSGEVIPKFLKVVASSAGNSCYPPSCPICHSSVTEESIRIYCSNVACTGRLLDTLLNFVQKIGIEDLSSARLLEMMEQGLVRDIPDLFALTPEKLLSLKKTKEKLAQKIFKNIQRVKTVELIVFLSALGIAGGALNRCEKIVMSGHNTLAKILDLTVSDIKQIDGFADKSATDFIESLQAKRGLILALLDHGFVVQDAEIKSVQSGVQVLAGKRVAITGTLTRPRSEIEKQIKLKGGMIQSAVNRQTDYLLTNETDSTSSKYRKAKELGVPILSEEDFLRLIESL